MQSRGCITYKIDLLTLRINNSIYIFVGESDRISWCHVPIGFVTTPVSHYLYTS